MTVKEVEALLAKGTRPPKANFVRVTARPWTIFAWDDGFVMMTNNGLYHWLSVYLRRGKPEHVADIIASTISLWPYYVERARKGGNTCLEVDLSDLPVSSAAPRRRY